MHRVLLIGGCGRIGNSIARDILSHTDAEVTITGRNPQLGMAALERLGSSVQFQVLDLSKHDDVKEAISKADLVVHSAGPFHYRDCNVLRTCIEQGVNYTDVSDERSFTQRALGMNEAAEAAGVTAIINTGVFPGISNSMVRKGIETLDKADSIQLSYVVAGSGGAGITVLRTTFIGLQRPFQAWLGGKWQMIKPYTKREALQFPAPYGRAHVYWYDMPESLTLQQTFPVQDVITKFGVVPDFYNHATWSMAHWLPSAVLKSSKTVEFLAQVSHFMTDVTDRFTGTGVGMRCDVKGYQNGEPAHYTSSFVHESAAVATGLGTGSIAELILKGKLNKPGVHPVERSLSTDLFEEAMRKRNLPIHEATTVPA
ncbi:MAG TPA: saccharopine dehydrogenase NADP-binding domain-containing protein [Leptolyngbyaceae cyanobacterium]